MMRLLTCGGVVSVRGIQCNIRKHLVLSGDNKHDSAPEPKLPRHLQRRRNLRLPCQEAIRQHLPDQVSYISSTLPFYYHSITFKRVHNTSYVISGLTLSSSALATAPAPRLDVLQAPQTSSASQPLTRSNTHLCAVIFPNNTVSSVINKPMIALA